MTTRERLRLLAPVLGQFPELGFRRVADLADWVRDDLGRTDALDRWEPGPGFRRRALAPARILHILAGNLAVSGMQSLAAGLVVGSLNLVKGPTDTARGPAAPDGGQRAGRPLRAAAQGRLEAFIAALPRPLAQLVAPASGLGEPADLVIAFGTDATLASLRRELPAAARFIGHGQRASLLWLDAAPATADRRRALAAACAADVAAYDQSGCLSPQLIAVRPGGPVQAFGDALAEALARQPPPPPRSLAAAAAIRQERDTAAGLGERIWIPPDGGHAWTIIHRRRAGWAFSPLHRTVFLREISPQDLAAELAPLAGSIGSIGLACALDAAAQAAFLPLRVPRFCRAGSMQRPRPGWRHDGRPVLADLVTWTEIEN